jgi:hypothetical protein
MTEQEFNDLTILIDRYNYVNEDTITPITLHATLWSKLNQLRTASNKNTLIKSWKYKKELLGSEYAIANKANYTMLDNEEHRFVVDFWLSIYH